MKLAQIQSNAGSFRHAPRATFLPEEGFFDTPIITQIGREKKFSAEIYVPAYFSAKNAERIEGLFYLIN